MHKPGAGFTLIELLIVIVFIGILGACAEFREPTAIGVPNLARMHEKAYFKAMVSDLRKLAVQQEIYYSNPWSNGYYTNHLTMLDVSASRGVTLFLSSATTQGWQATATHAALARTQQCGVYYGKPSTFPPAYVSSPGIVRCTNE